ncbi:arsenate reductase ArsC [Psychrobacter sp. I-STPA10]|uniref:arsenate reductase ArsC n=1 Tax=Psychrobacter sp. I-STPA10 TaxID=2585769 RepID=UPI001E3D6E64|nr:arsenate reductase ArsC [Psychrobacter sp. I-STPA10]
MSLQKEAQLSQQNKAQLQSKEQQQDELTTKPLKILFVCTHNRCRSILSEVISNQMAAGLIEAQSAGSDPADQVHPLTLEYLANNGYDISGLHSKSWQSLAGSFSPDVVITVCDQAAGERCPLWLGSVPKLHWGLADPSRLATASLAVNAAQARQDRTSEQQQRYEQEQQIAHAFSRCMAAIESRVEQLIPIALLPQKQRITALNTLIKDCSK